MRNFTIDLHEIVSTKNRIIKEILPNYFISWIGYAVAYNHRACTYLAAERPIAVEDTPEEILNKINRSVELTRALYEYKYPDDCDKYWIYKIFDYASKFRVFSDWEKSVLINQELIKYAEPISKFQTRLTYGKSKWSMIIHLPIKLLDIPR